ncbi:hypothetical protein N7450_005524 [Penicillium hetheringtonii]|uniref:Uncharacterized protein n=1 Tax=Penicillium hetheringtonii TaxID=911720 RepID=A0AAD6DJ79_9EURO|nr:hypothetical protein N7450_005524 [Penicillium hetheringtonii]
MAISPLSDSENRVLQPVKCIVEEAYSVVDFNEESAESTHHTNFHDPLNLCGVASLGSLLQKWPCINILGLSLEKYREMLIQDKQTAV